MRTPVITFCLCGFLINGWAGTVTGEEVVFVANGAPQSVHEKGTVWIRGDGCLECGGTERAEGNLIKTPSTWPEGLPTTPVDVFVSGSDGYHTFRIPSIVVTRDGTLLAFCEGRKSGGGDAGDIDLVLRRSTDLGRTWSPIQVVWDDEQNTCGNPCPVVDHQTGRIWLPLTWNLGTDHERDIMANKSRHPRRPYMTFSDDDGKTWAKPVEVPHLRESHWRWYATGPDKGVQISRGPLAGRLVVPCNHSDHQDPDVHPYRSHVIYSDDHGETWVRGGTVGPKTNESTIVELSGGALLDNMRSYHGNHQRAVAISKDGGDSWGEIHLDERLIEPVCQASILRYSWQEPGKPDTKSRILFSNPASNTRDKMTIRLSYDEGKSWPVEHLIYRKSAAYSCLARLPNGQIGLLFERDRYGRITLVTLNLEWLEGEE